MAEWMAPALFSVVIGLQAWILLEIIRLKVNVAEDKIQLGRISSDIESEKGTRKRLHDSFEARLRVLENHHGRRG